MTLLQLLSVFENAWVSEGFLSAEHEEKRLLEGKKVLEEFWKREKDSKDSPTFIEKEFHFNIGDSPVGETGALVRGRFVGIYDLETGLVGGYKPTKIMLTETESVIVETAKNIRENLREDKFPANPKYFGRVPACNYCAYNS